MYTYKVPFFITFICCMFFLMGCQEGAGRSAEELMPDLPEYTVVETEDLTTALQALNLATVAQVNPVVAANIAAVDALISCINKSGTFSLNIYSQIEEPLASGVVVIVNESRMFSLESILSCANTETETTSGFVFDPCMNNWVYREDGVNYHMIYAATTGDVCEDFCNNMLGCTAP